MNKRERLQREIRRYALAWERQQFGLEGETTKAMQACLEILEEPSAEVELLIKLARVAEVIDPVRARFEAYTANRSFRNAELLISQVRKMLQSLKE